jgi:hypothetical protein
VSYLRVIPRDLFNEANLLKCLGQAALLILDLKAPDGLQLLHHEPKKGFPVTMDEGDGSICCPSVYFRVQRAGRLETVVPRRGINSRERWPLYIIAHEGDDDREEEITVFDEEGNWTPEFLTWVTAP